MTTTQTSTGINTLEFLKPAGRAPGRRGSLSVGIELGDIDSDGDLDAFVVNNGQANTLLLNDGNGNFRESSSRLPGYQMSNDVSLGDVDGDGDLDAFVVNSGEDNQLLLNDGQGRFVESINQPPTNYYSDGYGVSLGDVDGDGDLDAVIANYWGDNNQLLLNDGNGIFTDAPAQLPGNDYSYGVTLGDLDNDGDLDAFVVNNDYVGNQVLLNDGTGGFTAAANQPGGEYSTSVSLGDVDGDGDLDAFVTSDSGEANQLLLNEGDGTFIEAAIQPPNSQASNNASFGDLDGDGDLDVFVTNYSNQSQVLLNDGNGVFWEEATPASGRGQSYDVGLGDLDADGDLDSFVVNFRGINQVLFHNVLNYELSGEGLFTAGEQGTMSLDYLYDGGNFQGELAVFDVAGMNHLKPGSTEFIQEAAQRALSESQGHVLIQDDKEGARFSDAVGWEKDFNKGRYQGIQQFSFEEGTQFAVMMVQNGSVSELAENPDLAQQVGKQATFSIPEANQGAKLTTRLVDFNGLAAAGNGLYGMEDVNLDVVGDRDYNDIVFQIRGATAYVAAAEDNINTSRSFTETAVGQAVLAHANRENLYTEGTFIVGETAQVKVDYLFDGGGFNKGELGIFNLSGMEQYKLGSEEFLHEAIRRASSGSNLGHIVIQDRQQAARFQSNLAWERDFNGGLHMGPQAYAMEAGDQFAIVLSQNVSLAQLAEDPTLASQFGKQALFSIPEANLDNRLASQMVALNGLGHRHNDGIYGMEDIKVSQGGDRDYNDLVFQLQGASSIVNAEAKIREGRDWRELTIGQDLLGFATQTIDLHLPGSKGRDTLIGSTGNDCIEGLKGRDVLDGGLGDDILTGGSGEDTFVLSANAGHDIITDFKYNYDVLGMSDGLTFNDLAFVDNDILLKGSNDILATLSGFNTTQLTASDFVAI